MRYTLALFAILMAIAATTPTTTQQQPGAGQQMAGGGVGTGGTGIFRKAFRRFSSAMLMGRCSRPLAMTWLANSCTGRLSSAITRPF